MFRVSFSLVAGVHYGVDYYLVDVNLDSGHNHHLLSQWLGKMGAYMHMGLYIYMSADCLAIKLCVWRHHDLIYPENNLFKPPIYKFQPGSTIPPPIPPENEWYYKKLPFGANPTPDLKAHNTEQAGTILKMVRSSRMQKGDIKDLGTRFLVCTAVALGSKNQLSGIDIPMQQSRQRR